MSLLLIRYGEIGLKGKNRGYFENKLVRNIKDALKNVADIRVNRVDNRFFVEVLSGDKDKVIARLQKIFGIVAINPVERAPLDFEEIKKTALLTVEKQVNPGDTFKVETKRSNKRFPIQSPEISREVGAYILENRPELVVDLHKPQQTVRVEIRKSEALVFSKEFRGSGGLPTGVTGKSILMLSGGIDSPVAAWLTMKRGVRVEALHFESPPFTSERSKEKVLDLCKKLTAYGGNIKLHIVPFTETLKSIKKNCEERMLITIMRRIMFRAAEAVAIKEGALSIVTGENLGQVASQTMESIYVIDNVVSMPVFRPLIGFDKTEIIELSEKIDTYDISIRPYEDCCTVFVPRRPVTRPKLETVEREESRIPVEELLADCLEKIETIWIGE